MSVRLAVNSENQLQEINEMNFAKQPPALKWAAKIISFIFHPVFVPIYVISFMVYIDPYIFAGFSIWNKSIALIQAFVMFTFFPVVTVLLLKALKFVNTIYLETQKDRIIPYIACGVWYFWVWYVWHNLPEYPAPAIKFAMAIFLASSLGLMANIYMKVSMHAISMGVMLTCVITLGIAGAGFGIYIAIALIIAGLVCTARLIASNHTQKEIYVGLIIGIISQLIGTSIGNF